MKQFAFIGLGEFALSMLERVAEITDQIIVVDDSPARIEHVKDLVSAAYAINLKDEEAFERVINEPVDVAIIDIPEKAELCLLVAHRLKKLGVPQIIAKSNSEEYEELLQLVGVSRVVNADREAAKRVLPLMLSSSLTNFMPISGDLVLAEVKIPPIIEGKSVIEADLRKTLKVNVVAVKFFKELQQNEDRAVFHDLDIQYRFQNGDIVLVTGRESDVLAFAGLDVSTPPSTARKMNLFSFFKAMQNRKKHNSKKT